MQLPSMQMRAPRQSAPGGVLDGVHDLSPGVGDIHSWRDSKQGLGRILKGLEAGGAAIMLQLLMWKVGGQHVLDAGGFAEARHAANHQVNVDALVR